MGQRYSKITDQHVQREIVLLKGYPCAYGRCAFCNYIEDNTTDELEIERINQEVLQEVTGEFGVLEIINSASVFELPLSTLERIRDVVHKQKIQVIYFEVYYGLRHRIAEIQQFFEGTEVRFRMGIETFDNGFRKQVYRKPFNLDPTSYTSLAESIFAICLLVCVQGQTREMIAQDIELALTHFRSVTINVFVENGTPVHRDPELYAWFTNHYSHLQGNPRVELLLDNKELGVFEQ